MRTLGGMLLLFAAGMLAFLWVRGYLSAGLARAIGAVQAAPPLQPASIGTTPGVAINSVPGRPAGTIGGT